MSVTFSGSRRAWLLLATLAFGDAQCILEPEDAHCEMASSCDACAARSGCGWCGATARCVAGTSLGPNEGACATWTFGTCDPNHCGVQTTCGSCTIGSGCGWCVPEHACRSLGAGGTLLGGCSGAWTHEYSQCNALQCSSHADCGGCVGDDSYCYWCLYGNQCVANSSNCQHALGVYPYYRSHGEACR